MIDHPLATLDAWLRYFDASALPILSRTHDELETLIERGEDATVQSLAQVAKHDALLALQTLRYLQQHRSHSQMTDVTTVERAILMVGVDPLLRTFVASETIEQQHQALPQGLDAVRRILQRAHHAAVCAEVWADQRHDVDGSEVMTAALLRDIAEILVGCFAPKLLLRIRAMQRADHKLRSSVAQKVVLGFPLLQLQLALIEHWKLPPILKMLMDDVHAEHPRIKTVATAVAFARHVANGWDDAALPDDFAAVADITGLPLDIARQVTIKATQRAAEDWAWFSSQPNMPMPPPDTTTADV